MASISHSTLPSDPQRLDVAALCRHAASLSGHWPQSALARLSADLYARPGDLAPAEVAWSAVGSQRAVVGGQPELWLHLQARTVVALQCQRCLQPVAEVLQVDRRLRFVRGEDEAARLDEESEDDVLALVPRLDLRELIEDELILALPLVPRHETCPQPLWDDRDAAGADDATGTRAGQSAAPAAPPAPHPFAALAALRRGDKPSGDDSKG